MPPRPVGRGAAKAPIRGGRGGKVVKTRGRGGKKVKSRRESVVEEIQPEPEQPPPKIQTWFDKIPPLPPKPDEELHKKLSAERKLRHAQKVEKYCKEELNSIFQFAMKVSDIYFNDDENSIKEVRRKRIEFKNGIFIPSEESEEETTKKAILPVKLEPKHSIDIQNYLRISKQPYYSMLESLFLTKISDSYVSDPNKTFSKLIETIQENSTNYPEIYEPDKPVLPFVICVVGPPYGGTTTICQLLMNTYSVVVIEAVYMPPPDTSRRKKGEPETPPPEPKLDYHLHGSMVIYYSDDKNAVQQISTVVKDIDRNTKGIIISGYPNTKQQLSSLEKSLAGNTIGRPNSARSSEKQKPAQCVITGFIISMNCPEKYETRYIDPLTGYVYSETFHRPGAADLVGHKLTDFVKSKNDIENRLVENIIPDQSQPSQKALSAWNSLTNSLKKNYSVITIENLPNSLELAEKLDGFVAQMLHADEPAKNVENLLRPSHLILPGACNEAVLVWRKCLNEFGRQIAEQNRLVTTIADKIGDLTKTATSRYHFLTSMEIGNVEKLEQGDLNSVWEESINNRISNVKMAKEVVTKSGLIELVIALVNAPRVAFIALIEKMSYVKWFVEKFSELFEKPENYYNIFQEQSAKVKAEYFNFKTTFRQILKIDGEIEPKFLELPEKPLKQDDKDERSKQIEEKGIQFLGDYFDLKSYSTEIPNFNVKVACKSLDIPDFQTETPFSDIVSYSKEFIEFVSSHIENDFIKDECQTILDIFERINKFVRPLEVSIVESIFNLHDNLINYAYSKFTHEMEGFCTNGHFSYDFSMVSDRDLEICRDVNSLKTDDVRRIIPDEVLTKMRVNIGSLHGVSTDDVLEMFADFEGGKYLTDIKICLNIMECGECMDISKFLELFE